jgi:hypothetical protein
LPNTDITIKEIFINNKQKYLLDNYPFEGVPKLTDKKHCIHCDNDIVVGDYKVFLKGGVEFIYCPNAPECDGTVIDWMDIERCSD